MLAGHTLATISAWHRRCRLDKMSSTDSYGLGLNDCNMITEVRNRKVPLSDIIPHMHTYTYTHIHITHMHIRTAHAQHAHAPHMPPHACMHAPDHNTVRQCTLKPYDMVVALDDVPHLR